MLISKIFTLTTRAIHNNLFKFHLYNPVYTCSNRLSCGKSQDTGSLTIPTRCAQYLNKLRKCPKPIRSKGSSQPRPKCNEINFADNYEGAYKNVINNTRQIVENMQDESNGIVEQLKNELDAATNNGDAQLRVLYGNIQKSLDELINLNPSFGSCKRRQVLNMNYEVKEAIDTLQCNGLRQIKKIQHLLSRLELDGLTCMDRARVLIRSCRRCKNYVELEKCTKENANYAEQIIDETSKKIQVELDKIKTMKNDISAYHKEAIQEVIKKYQAKNQMFVKYLEDCIYATKQKK